MRSSFILQENDGSVTKAFKFALLTALENRMGVFTKLVVNGDESIIPNSLKAALVCPGTSK